ncbi:F0F1-type ATP synthase assembly protein I [Croceifilum oryzae]|uniref:F0F1-type ATP synthase assembly protein I n=1 Tax=Croceifilum oryzae TaxID=1553429 RepID=A0AAJ1TKE3_9BACL|nr:hypothetical protein [Croceifilum oryzae]MDQ0418492.1 F0F1-type ATP synthase assembly protein I [Croceifilum oryzae]
MRSVLTSFIAGLIIAVVWGYFVDLRNGNITGFLIKVIGFPLALVFFDRMQVFFNKMWNSKKKE